MLVSKNFSTEPYTSQIKMRNYLKVQMFVKTKKKNPHTVFFSRSYVHQKDYSSTDNLDNEAIIWRLNIYLMKGNVKIDRNLKRSWQLF